MLGKLKIGLLDCASGELYEIDRLPFEIGSAEASDLRLFDEGIYDHHCVIIEASGKKYLAKRTPEALLVVTGQDVDAEVLKPKQDYMIQIGHRLMVLRMERNPSSLAKRISTQDWCVKEPGSGKVAGPYGFPALAKFVRDGQLNSYSIAYPEGAKRGFHLTQVMSMVDMFGLAPPPVPQPEVLIEEEKLPVATPVTSEIVSSEPASYPTKGAFTCPSCWLPFDTSDVLHVAPESDVELRGDPILGEGHSLRFAATQFDGLGHALSPLGTPCTDVACPHCRCQLQSGFLDLPTHIFSIVGAPQAGKSYYLATLIKTLEAFLPREFGVTFMNADPKGNALLELMKTQLFTADKPESAHLIKTDFEGEMYQTYVRHGHEVRLPRPFTYRLNSAVAPDSACHVVFYDNAGEHFEPNVSISNNPGALHIATSKAIFFLFDPTYNENFRKRLEGHHDPQLRSRKLDQQDAILAELSVRFRRILRMRATEKIKTPMAMMIGKSDTWMHLLGARSVEPPVKNGKIDLEAIDRNSKLIRGFLQEICPHIVAYVEDIAEEIVYFPVSALGHSPIEFDVDGEKRLGPDPGKMNPIDIEIPTLWALSKITPELVPSSPGMVSA